MRLEHLAAVFLSLMAAGCALTPEDDRRPADCRVMLAPDLAGDVQVDGLRCVKGAGGYLEFQANVINGLSSDRGVEWRVVWLDANGLEIPSAVSTWSKRMVPAHDLVEVRSVASSPQAVDFRFHLRRLRR